MGKKYWVTGTSVDHAVSVSGYDDRVEFDLPHAGRTFTVVRKGQGTRIRRILVGGKPLKGWFVDHSDLAEGKELTIEVEPAPRAFNFGHQ